MTSLSARSGPGGRVSPGRALASPTPPLRQGRSRPQNKADVCRRALRVQVATKPGRSPTPTRPDSRGTLWKLYWPEGTTPRQGSREQSSTLPIAVRPQTESPSKWLQERDNLAPANSKVSPKHKQKLSRPMPVSSFGFAQAPSQDWVEALRDGEPLSATSCDQRSPQSCRLDAGLWRLRCVQLSVGRSVNHTELCTRGHSRVGAGRLPPGAATERAKSPIRSPSSSRSPSPEDGVAQQPLGVCCGSRSSAWSVRSSTASSHTSARSTVLPSQVASPPASLPSVNSQVATTLCVTDEDAQLDAFGDSEDGPRLSVMSVDSKQPKSRGSSRHSSIPTAQAWSADDGRDAIPEEPDFSDFDSVAEVSIPHPPASPEILPRKDHSVRVQHDNMDMEDWRAVFPLEVLDACAIFYEARIPDIEGVCSFVLNDIGNMLQHHVSFPQSSTVLEAQSRLLISGCDGSQEVRLSSFTHFLNFVRWVGERVEQDSASSLWSSDDLHLMAGVFHRHSAAGRVPIMKMFSVVEEFGLPGLGVKTAEQQKWFAGVTKRVLEREGKARCKSQTGFCSFDDLLEILTAAVRDKARDQRRQEFALELKAQRKGGYTPLEIEDMRELHGVYSSKQDQAPLSRLTSLFSSLGVRGLSPEELQVLRDIVKVRTPVEHSSPDSQTPLPVFISYMGDVFARRVGDLQWHGDGSMVHTDLEGRTGFAAAMLRAEGLPVSSAPSDFAEKAPSDFAEKAHRRRSFTISKLQSEGLMGNILTEDLSDRQPSPPVESPQPTLSTLPLPRASSSRSSARKPSKGVSLALSHPASRPSSRSHVVSRSSSGFGPRIVSLPDVVEPSLEGKSRGTRFSEAISQAPSPSGSASPDMSESTDPKSGRQSAPVPNKGPLASEAQFSRKAIRESSADLTEQSPPSKPAIAMKFLSADSASPRFAKSPFVPPSIQGTKLGDGPEAGAACDGGQGAGERDAGPEG